MNKDFKRYSMKRIKDLRILSITKEFYDSLELDRKYRVFNNATLTKLPGEKIFFEPDNKKNYYFVVLVSGFIAKINNTYRSFYYGDIFFELFKLKEKK